MNWRSLFYIIFIAFLLPSCMDDDVVVEADVSWLIGEEQMDYSFNFTSSSDEVFISIDSEDFCPANAMKVVLIAQDIVIHETIWTSENIPENLVVEIPVQEQVEVRTFMTIEGSNPDSNCIRLGNVRVGIDF